MRSTLARFASLLLVATLVTACGSDDSPDPSDDTSSAAPEETADTPTIPEEISLSAEECDGLLSELTEQQIFGLGAPWENQHVDELCKGGSFSDLCSSWGEITLERRFHFTSDEYLRPADGSGGLDASDFVDPAPDGWDNAVLHGPQSIPTQSYYGCSAAISSQNMFDFSAYADLPEDGYLECDIRLVDLPTGFTRESFLQEAIEVCDLVMETAGFGALLS
ncbi:MAG: hypothetical protein QM597_05250 [Aeromicrobium sp.]|uniref:hypothetical protein n=1 Tax=Aeromicrobium sp. TaxID=1871063 RepID=UPI0039E4F913